MNDEKRTNPLSPLTTGLLVVGAVLLGFFSHALGGWGLPAGLGAAAVVAPILKYRRYWRRFWFWGTILALSILQVPLVILARPFMDRYKFGFNLVFATADLFVVIVMVNWVRPEEDEGDAA
jgi:hypothetical protein